MGRVVCLHAWSLTYEYAHQAIEAAKECLLAAAARSPISYSSPQFVQLHIRARWRKVDSEALEA